VKKGKYRVLTVRTAEADCIACVKGKYNGLPARTAESGWTACKHVKGKYNDLPAQTAESQCKKDCNAGSYINADKSVRLEVGYSMY